MLLQKPKINREKALTKPGIFIVIGKHRPVSFLSGERSGEKEVVSCEIAQKRAVDRNRRTRANR